MDGNRFDDITRKLAADTSRRSLLKRTAITAAALAGLGGASATDAARRPTPTPRPVSCLESRHGTAARAFAQGEQPRADPIVVPSDRQPVAITPVAMATATAKSSAAPPAKSSVMAHASPRVSCCTNDNCGAGLACIGNVCVCQATTSCATAGQNCGTFTDDCGAIHDCGVCTEPQTCGGGGTAGVCGCISTMTCEGRCGTVTTECGTILDCGNPCTPCQTCNQNTCQNVADGIPCDSSACVTGALCISGTCSGGRTVLCPEDVADRCNRSECDPELGCIKIPINEGGACTNNPCTPGACVKGVCTEKEMECPVCQSCQGDTCAPSNDGSSCGDGLHCLNGNCCNLPTIDGEVPIDQSTLMSCWETGDMCCDASSGACCPGTSECCDICVTYTVNGVSQNKCCEPENICGENCCWFTHMCVEGGCVERNRVCAGNVICDDVCCGGSGSGSGACCGPDSFCVSGVCKPVSTDECTSHDECVTLYGSGAVCAGLDFIPGPEPWEVRTPGVCCPNGFSIRAGFGGTGPIYACCGTNARPTVSGGCCAYPWHACDTTGTCTCSRATIRRWGS